MQTRKLHNIQENISLLGYGCMRFPTTPDGKIDREPSYKMIDAAYENGVNYYDSAYVYHNQESEEFTGDALRKYPRESYHLATKFPIWMDELVENEEIISETVEEQLRRFGTDYIDFYLVHGLNAEVIDRMLESNMLGVLEQKRAEGKIRYLGFSFHDKPEVLEKIVACHNWDFAQIQLNYYDWEYQDAKGQYEILERNNIACIVMEPVRGGTFANFAPDVNKIFKAARPDDSIASWAMRYVASLPNVLTILSGMSTVEQVMDNVKTLSNPDPITPAEQKIIDQALEAHKKLTMVPCTACRYCTDCPVGIDIPGIFSIYNAAKFSGRMADVKREFPKLKDSAAPSECIACGACSAICPQKIDIPEELKKIDAILNK